MVLKRSLVLDHLGNEYTSVDDMCDYYKVSKDKFLARIKLGWSLDKALTVEVNVSAHGQIAKDHLGNVYRSMDEMCKKYGITKNKLNYRLRAGWSLKDALTKGNKSNVKDHLGNSFDSVEDMCNSYNITIPELEDRLFQLKLSLLDSLEQD